MILQSGYSLYCQLSRLFFKNQLYNIDRPDSEPSAGHGLETTLQQLRQTLDVVQKSSALQGENTSAYRQIFLRSNDFTEWIFTFLPTFQTISKKG